jgi:3-phenylpropionate/cinnamic acid dioxygenase small subunit
MEGVVERARDAIERLLFLYAERMDAGDFAAVGALFAHARYGAGDGPLALSGAEVEAVNRSLVILYDDGTPRTRHVTTNVVVDADEAGGTASARSSFTVLQQVPGGPLEAVAAGRYHDRFERADGAWRFAERRILLDLVGDLSRHLRRAPPTRRDPARR